MVCVTCRLVLSSLRQVPGDQKQNWDRPESGAPSEQPVPDTAGQGGPDRAAPPTLFKSSSLSYINFGQDLETAYAQFYVSL